MPHIELPPGVPGIRGLFELRPDIAKPLSELADILLHAPNSLTPGERELIATYVSSQNDCEYCQSSHGATAAHHFGGDDELVAQVKRDFEGAPISSKLKALLAIAGKVHAVERMCFLKISVARGATALPMRRSTMRS